MKNPKEQAKIYTNEQGLVADGYDVVAYFTESKAVLGNKQFSSKIGEATYYFSSENNKAMFDNNTEQYIPIYGGWCAFAIMKEIKMEPSPKKWKIQDGKLMLFYDGFMTTFLGDPLEKWNKNPQQCRKEADEKWPTLNK